MSNGDMGPVILKSCSNTCSSKPPAFNFFKTETNKPINCPVSLPVLDYRAKKAQMRKSQYHGTWWGYAALL